MSLPSPPDLEIQSIRALDVDRLRPLWRELYEHNQTLASTFTSVTASQPPEHSWPTRRAFYEHLLETGGWIVVATSGQGELGYAAVSTRSGSSCSWREPDLVAVLETLVVASSHRSSGVGSALVANVRARCREIGVTQLDVDAVHASHGAVAFYEELGFKPFLLRLVSTV